MRVMRIMLVALTGILVLAGCQSFQCDKKVADLLSKMKNKFDPDNRLEKVQSQILEGNFRDTSKGPVGNIIIKYKAPNMMKIRTEIPGKSIIVKAYDGKTAWEFSSDKGYREITGKEKDEFMFQAAFYAPFIKMTDLFESIIMDEAETAKNKCYIIKCIPQKRFRSQPVIMYIDKKSLLIVKLEEKQDVNNEVLNVTTILTDYQRFDDILWPMTIISEIDENIMEANFSTIIWNEEIDNSEFDPPENLIDN